MIRSAQAGPDDRRQSLLERHETLICALLTVAIFAPYWPASVLPLHDSLLKYQFFHFAYSQFVTAGEFPLWVPYGSYGITAALYQLTILTPASYLVGAVGALSGAGDTLLLFKFSVFLEVALFAAGLLLLARSLYGHPLARLVLVAGGICSLSWLSQPYLNLHLFYLYPFLLLFLFAFLRTGDPGKLWRVAALGVLSVFGTAPYFAVLHLFVFSIIIGVAFLAGARPPLARGARRWFPCNEAVLALALAAVYAIGAWFGVENIVTVAPGREVGSNRVPIEMFLEYGRGTKLTAAYGYLSGTVTHADNTYYIGLLPLVLVALGLARLRLPLFLGVTAAALALVWLSFGGFFARMVYFFPAMSLFRHIGLTFGLSGLLFLVAGAWVIDERLGRPADAGSAQPRPSRLRWIVALVLALMAADLLLSWRPNDGMVAPIHHPALLYLVPLRVLAYLVAIAVVVLFHRGPRGADAGPVRRWVPLVLAFVFDIGTYQASVLYTLPRSQAEFAASAFAPDALPYRETRADIGVKVPVLGWKLALLQPRVTYLGPLNINRAVYSFNYTFLGLDPCYPRSRNDFWQRWVYEALVERDGRRRRDTDTLMLGNSRGPRAILGCGEPKVAVMGGQEGGEPGNAGSARVVHFSANRVEIDVVNDRSEPAWMYYADAFHPDWHARIDGIRAEVVRANVGFKAVRVPPGRHAVSLMFGQGRRQAASVLLMVVAGAMFLLGSIAACAAVLKGARAA